MRDPQAFEIVAHRRLLKLDSGHLGKLCGVLLETPIEMRLNLRPELFTAPPIKPSLPSGAFTRGKLPRQLPFCVAFDRGPAYPEPFAYCRLALSFSYSRYNPLS